MSSLVQQDKLSLDAQLLDNIKVFEDEPPKASIIEEQRQERVKAKKEGFIYDPDQGVYIKRGRFSIEAFQPDKMDEIVRKDLHPFNLPIPEKARYEHPYLTSTVETAWETTTDILPFAKYLRSKDRRFFMTLNKQQQVNALLMESLCAALWGSGERILKDLGYALKVGMRAGITSYDLVTTGTRLARKAKKPLATLTPIEDLEIMAQFDPKKALLKAARKAKIKNKDEIQAILEGRKVLPGASLEQLENAFAKHQFIKAVRSPQVLGKRRGIQFAQAPEAAFKVAARNFYTAEQVAEMSLRTATTEEIVNFTQYILGAPGQIAVRKAVSLPFWTTLRPIRAIYGAGESVLNTRTNIYSKMINANGAVNVYTNNKIELYKAMLTQRGLMKATPFIKEGVKQFKFTRNFTEAEMDIANKVLIKSDQLISIAAKEGTSEALNAARIEIKRLALEVNPKSRSIINATRDYFDTLYGEEASWAIRNVLSKELSVEGINFFNKSITRYESQIQQLFSTASSIPYDQKVVRLRSILDNVKKDINTHITLGDPLSVLKSRKNLLMTQDRIFKQLTFQSDKGTFVDYLENYVARTGMKEANLIGELARTVSPERQAFYTKARVSTLGERTPLTLEETIAIRTRSQAKRMFLFDDLKDTVNFAKKLPSSWRRFTEHYLSRMLGLPSQMDTGVAKTLEVVVGPLERLYGNMFGKVATGAWDEARVLRLAQSINNVTYMGFLGFKPFTGLRNLFQPLITVPTDLGGIKDIGTLARGYKALWTDTAMVKELNAMGILGEALPEFTRGRSLFNFGKILKFKTRSVELPTMQQVRDTALWFVTSTDKLNRYVTGASAMIKWDETLALQGKEGLIKLIQGRHEDIRVSLSRLIQRGDFVDARKGFIRDVVADTQYLYGVMDSPIISQSAGIFGKTGVVFQSWWMNYGELLGKWLTTGTADVKIKRLFTGLASNAMTYTTLANVWDRNIALSTTFLGPFPQRLQFPPAWQPINDMKNVGFSIANLATTSALGDVDEKDKKRLLQDMNKLADTSFSFLPGGLFFKGLVKGAERGGVEGFGKALIGIKTQKQK